MATGPNRARISAEQALVCPLLEGTDLSGARRVLVLVTATKDSLKLSEPGIAMDTVKRSASPDANVLCVTTYNDCLAENFRVTLVATSFIAHQFDA